MYIIIKNTVGVASWLTSIDVIIVNVVTINAIIKRHIKAATPSWIWIHSKHSDIFAQLIKWDGYDFQQDLGQGTVV